MVTLVSIDGIPLTEMSMPKSEICYRSSRLGRQFIDHFNKVLNDLQSETNTSLSHHCQEMQSWWDYVRRLTYKHNKKYVSDKDMIEWFFSGGGNYEDTVDNVSMYKLLVDCMLTNRDKSIISIIRDIYHKD
mgnify:FL=1